MIVYAAKSFAGPLGLAGRTLTPQGNPSDLAGLEEMSTEPVRSVMLCRGRRGSLSRGNKGCKPQEQF